MKILLFCIILTVFNINDGELEETIIRQEIVNSPREAAVALWEYERTHEEELFDNVDVATVHLDLTFIAPTAKFNPQTKHLYEIDLEKKTVREIPITELSFKDNKQKDKEK